MSHFQNQRDCAPNRSQRLALALVSVTASIAVCGGVVVVFAQAASASGLQAHPQAHSLAIRPVQSCPAQAGRSAPEACLCAALVC